jgi:hypothetical protein
VVTVRDKLGISRSLVYRLLAKIGTAATGFANRSGVLILALCTEIILTCQQIPGKRAVYDLSTVFHEFEPMDRPPVHELSAVNGHSLRFKCSATSEVLAAWVRGTCIRLPSCFANSLRTVMRS